MLDYRWFVLIPWGVLMAYWIVSARRVKKDAHRSTISSRSALARLIAVAAIILMGRSPFFQRLLIQIPAVRWAGAVLSAAGIACAIWARRTLGSNWSAVPSIKHGHEL